MKDSFDYPAAHSMDTTWFAVDPEGNVAVFNSGEAGAIPIDGYVGEDHYELLEALSEAGHTSGVIWEMGSLVDEHAPPGLNDARAPFMMILRSIDALRGELERAGARRIAVSGAPEGSESVVVDALSSELHSKLHRTGACLGCTWHFEDEEMPDPARYGLYRYEHSCENWISGPYHLKARPERPLRTDALPPSVAEHCVRVDRPFRDTTSLNPPEHWPCESWEPAWLASDGKTVHPFPGREKEFEEAKAHLDPEYVLAGAPTRTAPENNGATNGHGATERKPWWKFW